MNSENEIIYKSMSFSAAVGIASGIVVIVAAVTAGILLFVSSARLVRDKSRLIF